MDVFVLASIPSPPFSDLHIGPVRLTLYGLMIGLGVVAAFLITRKRFAAFGGDPEASDAIVMHMAVFGFLGARAAYVSTHFDRYRDELWKVIAIWEGGLALFGGITVGAIAFWVTSHRLGVDRRRFLDAFAPALPVAQALGRWGNYFNQELFGTPSDLPWAVEIDRRFRPAAYADSATFHPTFLYESLWNVVLAVFIVWLGKRVPRLHGRLIGVYLAGYGLMRFLLELIRTDTTFRFLGLSRNGWVSIAVVLIGLAVLAWPSQPEPPDEEVPEIRQAA